MTNLPIITHTHGSDRWLCWQNVNRIRCLPCKRWMWDKLMLLVPALVTLSGDSWQSPGPGPCPAPACVPRSELPPLLSSHSAALSALCSRSPPGPPGHLPPVTRARGTGNVTGSRGAEDGQRSGQSPGMPWSSPAGWEPGVTRAARTRKLN